MISRRKRDDEYNKFSGKTINMKIDKKGRNFFNRCFLSIIISGIIVFLCFGIYSLIVKSRILSDKITFFKIEKIIVKGTNVIDSEIIISTSRLKKGISLFDHKIVKAEAKLKKIAGVERVAIHRRLPGTLVINITERTPVALVNKGTLYLMDRQGYMWKLRPYMNALYPVISGVNDTVYYKGLHRVKQKDIDKTILFFDEMKKIDPSLYNAISQVDFSDDNGIYVTFRQKPVIVKLSLYAMKKNISDLYKIIARIEQLRDPMPEHIDLCYNNLAFVW